MFANGFQLKEHRAQNQVQKTKVFIQIYNVICL